MHISMQVGEVIGRFERKGFTLVGLKMHTPSRQLAEEHYADLSSKPFFKDLVNYIISGPVVCMVSPDFAVEGELNTVLCKSACSCSWQQFLTAATAAAARFQQIARLFARMFAHMAGSDWHRCCPGIAATSRCWQPASSTALCCVEPTASSPQMKFIRVRVTKALSAHLRACTAEDFTAALHGRRGRGRASWRRSARWWAPRTRCRQSRAPSGATWRASSAATSCTPATAPPPVSRSPGASSRVPLSQAVTLAYTFATSVSGSP